MNHFYKKLLFLLLALLPFTGFGQTKTLAWVKEFDDEIIIFGNAAEDADGNLYFVGNFRGTRDFDPGPGIVSLTSVNSLFWDGFVLKLNSDGEFIWVKQIKGLSFGDSGYLRIQLGLNNDLLVSGTAYSSPNFGDTEATTLPAGVFLAKYSLDGDFLHARKIHNTGGLLGSGSLLRQDPDGSLYYSGSVIGQVDFDASEEGEFILGPNYNYPNPNTILTPYILKTDVAGNFIWATSWYVSMAPAFDRDGNLFVSGTYDGSFQNNPVTGKPVFIRNQYSYESKYSLLARLDPANGEVMWARYNPAGGIRIDHAGNIFCYGLANGQPDFDPDPDTEYYLTGNTYHYFIQKLTHDGNLIWVKSMEGDEAPGQTLHLLDDGGFYLQSSSGFGTYDIDLDPDKTYLLSPSGTPYAIKYSAAGELEDVITGGGSFIVPPNPQRLLVTHRFYNSYDVSLNPLEPHVIHSPFSLRLIIAKYILTSSTCPSGIAHFTRSSDISLPSECTLFDGSIVVEGDQITNLSGLAHLEKITGDLVIRNTALTNLSDLANLRTIGGKLEIDGNSSLTNLSALNGLSQLGSLSLKNNPSVNRLPDLPGVSALSGSLEIENNSSMTQLDGLPELTSAGSILVSGNSALTSMSGLKKLKTVNLSVTIRDNQALTDMSGFGNVETATPYVVITYNPLLSTCTIPWLCLHLSAGKSVSISGNSPGCENRDQVSAGCQNLPVAEITSFSASRVTGTSADQFKVQLSWELTNEFNAARIEIFRQGEYLKIGELVAGGVKTGPTAYSFIDESAKPGINQYYLLIYNSNGYSVQSGQVMVELEFPYAPIVVSGCEQINGTYNVDGIDSDGRYTYQAAFPCVVMSIYPCSPQYIRFRDGRWRLYVEVGNIAEEVASNLSRDTPGAPETGWIVAPNPSIFCPGEEVAVSRPAVKTANCSNCNWSDPDTWIPAGVPAFENVVINGNVILDIDGTATDLTVNAGKSLLSPTGRKLTIHGKVNLEGELQAGEMVSPGFFVSQEIDGTKLNVKSFNNPNNGNVRLTGNLTVVDPENPSQPSIVSSGRIFLGDYDLECNSIRFTESSRSGTFVVTDGQGSLKYHFAEGETEYKTLNIGNVIDGAYVHLPAQIKREQNTTGDVIISARVEPEMFLPVPDGSGYLKGLWEITASGNAAGETYTISLGWDNLSAPPLFTPGFNFNNAYMKRWDGNNWYNVSGPHQVSTSASIRGTGISQFSHWAVFDSETALPVMLTSFKASRSESNSVRLDWATTEEVNASHFEVEHSLSGKEWSKIGGIKAAGAHTGLKSYTYIHTNPSLSLNYYRLRSVDTDGSFSYSAIESVSLNGSTKGLFVYPNPAREYLSLEIGDQRAISSMQLFNMAGNEVLLKSDKAGRSLDVRHLPAGSYLLRISRDDSSVQTFRIVIGR